MIEIYLEPFEFDKLESVMRPQYKYSRSEIEQPNLIVPATREDAVFVRKSND